MEKEKRAQEKYSLLKDLSEAFGVSGNEQEVRSSIMKEIRKYVDEINLDKFGNLIAHKKAQGQKIMLSAHMDEIGLMVKNIDKYGNIYCSTIGGLEPNSIIGERIHIPTKNGNIHGVITTKQISNDEETTELPKINDLIIDVGSTGEEIKKLGIEVGSYINLEQESSFMGPNYISGKAFDDRIGCFILIEVAKQLKNLDRNVYYAFTVQEEVGLYGAKTSVYSIDPDWGIAVDTTNSDDFSESPTKFIGQGPCITAKDSDMIGNKCINVWLKEIAKKSNIPYQVEVNDIGTTDALSISLSKGGIPATALCVPVRNIHTNLGIAHIDDIENAIKLLVELLKKPPQMCLV